MGLLNGVTDIYKKGEAAVVVQNLLEHQARIGLLDVDPGKLANHLVSLVWDQSPDMFGGAFGQRPHKISVAVAALANGIDQFDEAESNRNALILSVGNILAELKTNGILYPLNGIDHTLIEAAASIFLGRSKDFQATASPERKATPSVSDRSKTAVHVASTTLKMQVMLAQATAATFESDNFSLGYVFGFNDGILQALDVADELESLAALAASYHALFDASGASLLRRSMDLRGTGSFDRGRALGGKEAYAFFQNSRSPMGLASRLQRAR